MTASKHSLIVRETLHDTSNPRLRVDQVVRETLRDSSNPAIKITRVVREVLRASGGATKVLPDFLVRETLRDGPAPVRVAQAVREVLISTIISSSNDGFCTIIWG